MGQEHVVRKSKFTEDQIAFALKQAELGISVEEVCRKMDLTSLESSRNKIDECRFFLDLASREQDRAKLRWLLSAFLNAAYSYFEMAAVEAHFKFCGEDGEPYADAHALTALEQHVIVERNRAGRVKTIAVTPTVKKLFDIRKGNTHYFPLAIMEARSPLPEGFEIGKLRGEGIPALEFGRHVMDLVERVQAAIAD